MSVLDAGVNRCVHDALKLKLATPTEQHGVHRRSVETLIQRGYSRRDEFSLAPRN